MPGRPTARLHLNRLEDRTTPTQFVPEREILVTTAADVVDPNDGLMSLREAIADAHTPAFDGVQYRGQPIIRFAPELAGATIAVSQVGGTTSGPAAFEITTYVQIEGSGQKIARAADAPLMRLFNVIAADWQLRPGLSVKRVELLNGYSEGVGGAILSVGGYLDVRDSVLADNSAAGLGGAIASYSGRLYLTNSTFTANTARPVDGFSGGGAVFASAGWQTSELSLTASTLAGNTAVVGTQVYAAGPAIVYASHSVLFSPPATGLYDLLVDTPLEYASGAGVTNLIGSAAGYDHGLILSADPLLGPLQDNGGPTRTMLPAADSPAVDAGDGYAGRSNWRDQRGFVRGVGLKADLGAAEFGANVDGSGYAPPSFAVGAAAGELPEVRLYQVDGSEVRRFLAYAPEFRGGVRVAMADVTGDGVADVITAAGPGGGPHVKVFDGASGKEVRSFYAFEPQFTGGVNLAVGNVTGDGPLDVVLAAGAGGGPRVKVLDGQTFDTVHDFYAFDPSFTGGVSVAVTANFPQGLVVAAGPGGGPHVRVLDARTLAEWASFYAYDPGFGGGVNVAFVSDHLITGTVVGAPHVKAFRDTRQFLGGPNWFTEVGGLFVGDAASTGGVVVGGGTSVLWPPSTNDLGLPIPIPEHLYAAVGSGPVRRYYVGYSDIYDPVARTITPLTQLGEVTFNTEVPGPVGAVDGLPYSLWPLLW